MPVPFARSASQTRPTFSRDFAGLKTLDHGAGPAIAFTRGSNATYFDANGVLQTASTNEPRFDHNPSTGASLGLLIEESRTNSIRNSQAGGSTNGVIGSGGVLPTNWAQATVSGFAYEVIGTGTVSGLSYIDVKISGTNSSGSLVSLAVNFESGTQVVAANAQVWTSSFYTAITTGSTSGTGTIGVNIRENDASGNFLANSAGSFTPTSTLTRVSHTRTLNNASTARINTALLVTVPNTNTIDFTLRIAAPQLEQGAFPTSYIPTTNAAATRSADSAVVTPISSFYNQSEGTVVVEASYANAGSDTNNANRVLAQFDDETSNNRHWIVNRGTNGAGGNAVATGGVTQATTSIGSTAVAAGVVVKLGAALKENDVIAAKDGTLSAQAKSATMPLVTRLGIGRSTTTAANLQGHIRKVAYWPKRLSNTLLQQLTT